MINTHHFLTKLVRGLLCLLFFLCASHASAQLRLEGMVLDATSQEALPFVNICIEGTVTGTLSGKGGRFMLCIPDSGSLKLSSVGYHEQVLDLASLDVSTLLKVELKPQVVDLHEVSVKADFSFDKYIYKRVLKNKRKNQARVNKQGDYQINKQTLMMLAVDDSASLSDYAKKALIKSDKWGSQFLPVYKSEGVHQVSVDGKRKSTKEVGRKTEGIFDMLNQQLEELVLQKLSTDFDFYRNQITIFDHGFISPLSAVAYLHYNIYLVDSLRRDDELLYKFNFYPKDKKACLFQGTLWVDSETYALASITTTLPKTAGINYVKSMNIDVVYESQPDGGLFYKTQNVRTLLSLVKPVDKDRTHQKEEPVSEADPMFLDRNILVYEKTHFSLPTFEGKTLGVYTYLPAPVGIDTIDQMVTAGIASLRQSPKVRLTDVVIGTCLTGYYDGGIIDVGPIHDIYTTNYVEGGRVTIPLRTNANLSEKFSIGGYAGMGTKSKELKYGAHFNYFLPTERRGVFSLKYDNDYISASQDKYLAFVKDNAYAKGNGNLISAVTSEKRDPYMLDEASFTVAWVQDVTDGFEITLAPYYSTSLTSSSYFLPLSSDGVLYDGYNNYGALLNMRFSFGQKAEDYFFQRFYYNNQKPVINLSVDFGQTVVDDLDKQAPYFHLHGALKNRFALGRYNFRMLLNAGYIGGQIPYTMLHKPSGNYSLGYARYGYNLLHFASFAHNAYANAFLSCNFGGLVLNHIPLINKLHLREVASFKCYYGALTKQHSPMFDIPSEFQNDMTKPYTELGVGVGNLLKVLRIEYVHLLNNNQAIGNYASKHGVRMKFEIEF